MSHFMVRWLKLSLVVIVGCGFLAMMIYALINREEIRSSEVEPPLILPPSEPLKRRPDQPGGLQIPNRDKLVFDLLDSSNTTLGATGMGSGRLAAGNVSDTLAEDENLGVVAVSETRVPAALIVSPIQVAKPAPVIKEPPVDEPVEKKAEPQRVETKPAEAKPVAVNGKWGIQLAAVNSVADGNAFAAKASKDFAALKGLSPRVAAAPGGKKFRVQFTGLKDREAAAAVCSKLAGKQACFPVAP